MKAPFLRVFLPLIPLALIGAGCTSPATTMRIAQPFAPDASMTQVAHTDGFGTLPAMPFQHGNATVTLAADIPALPANVTVIRPSRGATNDTAFYNLTSVLGISDGFIGRSPNIKQLTMQWDDDSGHHWSYDGSSRLLSFSSDTPASEQLTVSTPPVNSSAIETANNFLLARGIQVPLYGSATISPDWSAWWNTAQQNGLCMNAQTISTIRAIGTSASFLLGTPPALPTQQTTQCVSPEFPTKLIVRYRLVVDGRAVVRPDGTYVNGVELAVDTIRNTVVAGNITLTKDPERSDYPALTIAQVTDKLKQGGTNGVSGDVTITSYDFASLRVLDAASNITYLIPSLIANGTRKSLDGSVSNVDIVVPLVAE